jgi:outer membrane lipoprotein-sorting protein
MSKLKTIVTAAVLSLATAVPAIAEKLSLSQISSYFNTLKTAKSDFMQISDDGSVQTGTLFIQRPGKMRFEYDPPQKALVLASNNAVAIFDNRAKGAPETYPLGRTPLSIILARKVNLQSANAVVGHSYDGKHTIVTAQDPKNPDIGRIQMKFSASPVTLDEWVIQDAHGGSTTIRLGDTKTGMSYPRALFDIDAERSKRSR